MYNELLFEIWEQDKINRKGKATVTNFDKVKELITLDKINLDMSEIDICSIIHTVRKEQTCIDRSCNECYKWLKQEYEEPPKPILTDKEKEYLSSVIKPFRDRIRYIMKEENSENEWISITMEDWSKQGVKDCLTFPNFQLGTMYKNMDTIRAYTLEELGL